MRENHGRELDELERGRRRVSLGLSVWLTVGCAALSVVLGLQGPAGVEEWLLTAFGAAGAVSGLALTVREWSRRRAPDEPADLLDRLAALESRPGIAGRHVPPPALFLVFAILLVLVGLAVLHGAGSGTGWIPIGSAAWILGFAGIAEGSRVLRRRLDTFRARLHRLEAAESDADGASGDVVRRRRRIEEELAEHDSSVWRWKIVAPALAVAAVGPLFGEDGTGSLLGYLAYLVLFGTLVASWMVRKTMARSREVRELEAELEELLLAEAGGGSDPPDPECLPPE